MKRDIKQTTLIALMALIVLTSLTGCRPKGILSQQEMQSLLYDMHRADGILQESGLGYGHDEALGKYYEQVLEKHGLTQEQFDSSLVWYTKNPKRFEHIYPKVITWLQADVDQLKHYQALENGRLNITEQQSVAYLDSCTQVAVYGYSLPESGYGVLKNRENTQKYEKNDEKFVYVEI